MIALVLGGANSGKSAFAEGLAAASGRPVTYVATAVVGDDADFAARVSAHQARRPAAWRTVEAGAGLPSALAQLPGDDTALVDSLGTWVAATSDFDVDIEDLVETLVRRAGPSIIVSEEVGLGVHPSTAIGGKFRDRLGLVNQAVSAVASQAFLVVAGRALRLDPPSGPPTGTAT